MQHVPEFWIVFSPTGPKAPTCQHSDEDRARQEARRLASAHQGQSFYVMKATMGYRREDPLETLVPDNSQVPF